MLKTAAVLVVTGYALSAAAQDQAPQLPKNSIDCNQFKKTGPKEWMEVGTAVFDLGSIKDINLTNQPVTPGYFKFDGIDVYPVLEQKCGAPAQEEPAKGAEANKEALATLSQETASPKAEPEQPQSPPASAPSPAPKAADEPVQAPERGVAGNPEASMSCGDRKSVYVADAVQGATVEIAFQNKNGGEERSGPDSEFIIRQSKNNELEWAHKGKQRHGRFIFAPQPVRERGFTPASIAFARQEAVALVPGFIKPNRNGTGEPILYVSGLKALFASRETVRRLKIEGKTRPGLLPEAFYFDRCE